MKVGVVFPQTEIGADASAVKDYAQASEELGFSHILAYDHVLGANPASRADWRFPYSHLDMFHEPLVLFGYLAGLTKRIEFATGIIILPQRQTVLVAKQAAAVDVLSNGGYGSVSASAGTPSNTKRLAKTSRIADVVPKNRSMCCASSGPSNLSPIMASGTRLPTPASTPCRCSDRFHSGRRRR